MRLALAFAFALLAVAPARADPGGFGFNFSGVFGGGTTHTDEKDSAGIAWGIRPEALFRRTYDSDWSFGPFVEVGSMGGAGVAWSAGATLTIPLAGALVVAPSGGVFTASVFDQGYAAGWSAGVLVGKRHRNDISYFDATFGLRADYLRTFSGDRSGFSIAVQLDLVVIAALGAFL
jgi:hypothetical protein